MRRKINILFSCLLFIFSNSLFSQSEVDSLTNLLNTLPEDTNKAKTYLNLHITLHLEDPELGYGYLEKSLRLSSALDYKKGQLKSLLDLGIHLETRSEYDSALALYLTTQSIAEELGRREDVMESLIGQSSVLSSLQRLTEADSITKICINIGKQQPIDSQRLSMCYTVLSNIAYFRSEYEKSIEYDLKGLDYNTGNLFVKARSLLNIGTTHDILGDHEKAIDYYLNALEVAKEAHDSERITATIQLELGNANTSIEEYAKAINYYELAMVHFEKVGDQAMQAEIHQNLGKIRLKQGAYEKAIIELKTALTIIETVNSPTSKGHFNYQLGRVYFEMKDFTNAEKYYKQSKAIFDQLENTTMSLAILSRLSDLYAATNEYQKAYTYLQEVKILEDSISTANTKKSVAEIEEKYQNEQKEKEIALLNAENEIATLEIRKQEDLRNYLIIGAFLLVLLVGVIYSRYQLKVRANEKLKELDYLKTNFFTNISHEFRTPLTLILSPLQRLMQQEASKQTKNTLSVIHRNASVLNELTNQLLDLSKLEAGKLTLQVSQHDLGAFLRVMCASFESLAVSQNIEFIQEVNDVPDQGYYDEDKIQKILNNLLSNAFKFTSKEGKVIIRASYETGQLTISVRDTGAGISQEDQELIFKRFHQNNTNTPSAAGTGVGLTLSKELAVLHKGDIDVESEPGQGSTFTLQVPILKSAYLPAEVVEEDRIDEKNLLSTKRSFSEAEIIEEGTSEKIALIVEDNPDLRNHISTLLKSEFKVRQSIDGKAGIKDALDLVPDIVISDLMMPEVDGAELCNTLKANEKTSHIPIILLTAKADRDTKIDGLKTGADDFLTKPFDNEELLVRVQNLISQRENLQTKYAQTLLLEPSKIKIDSPEEVFIKKALEIVDRHLSNSEFTVEAFQKEIGMSRMQLHRKLKALTNFSASEFIKDIRLQRAADLLATNGINVTEVAYSCGFNSISYFTQCFKHKYGINPSKYLKNYSDLKKQQKIKPL